MRTIGSSLHTNQKGFSAIELLVALFIFSLVIIAGVDVMLQVMAAQAKAVAVKSVLDNARFSLELMTRELRTGYEIQSTTNCSTTGLEFISVNRIGGPQRRFYYLVDTDGNGQSDAMYRIAMDNADLLDCTRAQLFTSPDVIIDRWTLIMRGSAMGAGSSDGQPFVTVGFKIHSRDRKFGQDSSVTLQTTVVQRTIDLP